MKDQVYRTNCSWQGIVNDLEGVKCPECGEGKYIEDVVKEFDFDNQILGGGDFNWNKK